MAAKDDPKSYVFRRGDTIAASEVLAAWASVLTGPAMMEFMSGKFSAKATEAWQKRQQSGLKPGIREGRPPKPKAKPVTMRRTHGA